MISYFMSIQIYKEIEKASCVYQTEEMKQTWRDILWNDENYVTHGTLRCSLYLHAPLPQNYWNQLAQYPWLFLPTLEYVTRFSQWFHNFMNDFQRGGVGLWSMLTEKDWNALLALSKDHDDVRKIVLNSLIEYNHPLLFDMRILQCFTPENIFEPGYFRKIVTSDLSLSSEFQKHFHTLVPFYREQTLLSSQKNYVTLIYLHFLERQQSIYRCSDDDMINALLPLVLSSKQLPNQHQHTKIQDLLTWRPQIVPMLNTKVEEAEAAYKNIQLLDPYITIEDFFKTYQYYHSTEETSIML